MCKDKIEPQQTHYLQKTKALKIRLWLITLTSPLILDITINILLKNRHGYNRLTGNTLQPTDHCTSPAKLHITLIKI